MGLFRVFLLLKNKLERTTDEEYKVVLGVFKRTWGTFFELVKSKMINKYCHWREQTNKKQHKVAIKAMVLNHVTFKISNFNLVLDTSSFASKSDLRLKYT